VVHPQSLNPDQPVVPPPNHRVVHHSPQTTHPPHTQQCPCHPIHPFEVMRTQFTASSWNFVSGSPGGTNTQATVSNDPSHHDCTTTHPPIHQPAPTVSQPSSPTVSRSDPLTLHASSQLLVTSPSLLPTGSVADTHAPFRHSITPCVSDMHCIVWRAPLVARPAPDPLPWPPNVEESQTDIEE
jgi:hypothetical protein